jgi:hypothetical protein
MGRYTLALPEFKPQFYCGRWGMAAAVLSFWRGFRSVCVIAGGGEGVGALVRRDGVDDAADGAPEALDGVRGVASSTCLAATQSAFRQMAKDVSLDA